ncbi:beta-1,4-glucuronyltransferase 1 [Chelonus insularis]|uniref:beta-1,4-glucuronyltransferase 1 n=1 Tax=Chelonus insularis TaxID=460826 RepID=UPI00158F52D1|nr:beta-1,4-glucuronyltransferase 1 [Chelonus insularis]XP_034937626.1 beta-1,4-glucuronyltransferase 1 [Chelonus insularis]XP_034937627.1 beta-1,4-glucuronyltransferase 1 [Chelonus insularis]XP_034937628.1 beta-1,4-glucuronyltransferase 1 [Chelonus insularis]XP_034937629.1 beta-1,4-glucuronyltransferase 1 [Chelonus insularis]
MNHRSRYFSLLIVMVLSLTNILFTFLLLQSKTCTLTNTPLEVLKPDTATHWNNNLQQQEELTVQCMSQNYDSFADENVLNLNIHLGKWDNRRLYKSFDSVLIGTKFLELSESNAVCLATQSSLEKIYSLVQVAHHWTGPISVAIYAAGDEEFEALQKYLIFLRKCYMPIFERINFSLTVPKQKSPTKQPQNFDVLNYDCTRPEATLSNLVSQISEEHTNWRLRNVYPQNHMRNLARKNCQTDWVFLTDIDIIPSIGLASSLNQFLRDTEKCDKCAYVVPTYEIDTRVKFPSNKSELMRLTRKGLARPFHWKVFIHNQYATNFTRWVLDVSPGSKEYENILAGKTYISHNVTNFEFLYEPFYVSKDIAPAHDERFLGYGYTRNTQVYEMFIAGYQFKVLSPVFTVHWGLQSRRNRSVWRERQNILNRRQFEQFKKEIYTKYLHKTSK